MPKDDMTDDVGRWLPEEGWYNVEVVRMELKESKQGNPMYEINFASASNSRDGIIQLLTNIPGKRWLLRQLLESAGIKSKTNKEGREIFDWDVADVEGKTVSAHIIHDKTPFIDRNGETKVVPKARIDHFNPISVNQEQ